MRRKIITLFAVCLLALCLTVVFVACDDNTGGGGGDDKGTLYSIQAPAASDVYTVSGLPEGAYEGDTVTFTVTLTDPENSILTSVKVEYEELEADENGTYSFAMPANAVTVEINAHAFAEQLTDGGVTFAAENPTTITVGGDNGGGYWSEDGPWIDCWKFNIKLDWSQTANLSDSSYVISSNQSVIPDSAITYKEGEATGGGYITDMNVLIDSSLIAPGTTWIEIYLDSNETSANGTVCIKITVTDHLDLDTMTESVKIDFGSYADEGDDVIVRFFDSDYIYGSYIDNEPAPTFVEVKAKVGSDGTATFTFDYIIGHEYSLDVYLDSVWYSGTVDDDVKEKLIVLKDDVISGGDSTTGFNQYIDGRLSFVSANYTIKLEAEGTWASLGM